MASTEAGLAALLDKRHAKGRFRRLKSYDPALGLTDFSSNDYLSLTSSPTLRKSYLARLATSPNLFGSTGSRLLSGCTPAHFALEERLRSFFNSPSALLFNSGWDANVSFFATVPQEGDWVIYDELVHASVHSGLRAGRVPASRRRQIGHNDPLDLERVLREISDEEARGEGSSSAGGRGGGRGTVFLALESLYSMDGDLCPLTQFLDVLDRHVPRERQCVVLDEAHSTGVYGRQGRGLVCALGETDRVAVRLMTFGKAVGGSGAVLLSSETVRTFLINFARPLIFSTALPHSTLIALDCAWDVLQSSGGDEASQMSTYRTQLADPQRRARLLELTRHFHTLLEGLLDRTPRNILHLPDTHFHHYPPEGTDESPTLSTAQAGETDADADAVYLPSNPLSPILGLVTPKPHALSAFLLEKGFIVRPVVPPTVPPGGERIRICLRADMERELMSRLVASLGEWVDREQSFSPERRSSGDLTASLGAERAIMKAKL